LQEHTANDSLLCSRTTLTGLRQLPFTLLKKFFFNYAPQPFKAYCAMWVRRSNFRHQASPHVSPRESTQREMSGNFA